ncbi:MAG: hypothetical protein C0602_02410 [Denitrovibrio sp.]|nr:MAG: hypothetical protein C0602_02410 [Denitrovibrio sp.]
MLFFYGADMALRTKEFNVIFIVLFSFWTMLMIGNSITNYLDSKKAIIEIASKEANLSFMKDTLYRRWVSRYGGIYVPVSEHTPPNPYLSDIKNRDITTPDGKQLTLINPAYMTRLVFEMADKDFIQAHLTSDKLKNPINKPDKWEERALEAILSGAKEFKETDLIDGEPYLRFMRPFVTEKSCLKCHSDQGYKVGDIRGGISVSVPLKDYYKTFKKKSHEYIMLNLISWLFGGSLLFYALVKLGALMKREKRLSSEKDIILRELNHRVKNNLQIISSIIDLQRANGNSVDKDALLKDIQWRLVSMATMHSMFQCEDDLIGVKSDDYLEKMVSQFSVSYKREGSPDVNIKLKADPIIMSATQALSCGLIVNELLTNSFKHAFKEDNKKPVISIEFKVTENNATLIYKDNGVGFDTEAIKNKPDSLGFILIDSMAEKLNAEVSIIGDNGFKAEFNFFTEQS